MLCTVPSETLRGLPVGRSRCNATARGCSTANASPVPASGTMSLPACLEKPGGRRARCRAAGSRRRDRRRSRSAAARETSANVPRLHDGAVLEDDEAIGERRGVERVVRDEQSHARERRELAAQLAPHRAASRLVERGERLVEEQEPRARSPAHGRARRAAPGRPTARAASRRRAPRGRLVRARRAPGRVGRARPVPAAAQPERDVLEHAEVREQQVVLEHDADRAPLGRDEHVGRRRRGRRRRARCARDRAATRPASARSNVVLPAPFGPSTATVSPSADLQLGVEVERAEAEPDLRASRLIRHRASDRGGTRARRRTPRAARGSSRSRPAGSTRAGGRPRAAVVWVRPWMLPANVIVAPNSPSARAHASAAPATSPGAMSGSVTRRNTVKRPAPSVAAASS